MNQKTMDKIEVIRKHKSGNPKEESQLITWIEFLSDIGPETTDEMYGYATQLLNGDFLYSPAGYTYFLNGINLREQEIENQ